MDNLLLGIIAACSFVAALFFLRFWKSSGDNFFLLFAGAFGIETVSRIGLALTHPALEGFPTFYLMRLSSFTLIFFAILNKNRSK